jgi:hypothetical protein
MLPCGDKELFERDETIGRVHFSGAGELAHARIAFGAMAGAPAVVKSATQAKLAISLRLVHGKTSG